jgi:16S rRNA (adenine1518-N6/adenine1519-N6)-dimethyltransferase
MSAVAGRRPSGYEPDEPSGNLVQPSLRRLRQFGVRPDHDLGQNFLIDSNILAVIGRAAEISPGDVVLEVGGGLGVLSEYLAQHAQHVHVVEIDQRLHDALCDATEPYANVTVHWADALVLDLRSLQPVPTKVVANLPYGIAASVLLRSVEELASVSLWVAMVQREVGERLAAAPVGAVAGASKGAYGAPSVLAQLACDVDVVRAIPRTVFHPVPNVDSVLMRLRRRADGRVVSPALRALVAGGFAHRRKTLAGSLGLAGTGVGAPPAGVGARGASGSAGGVPRSREQIREALVSLGHPADARAERLSPEDFLALAGLLEL